jgi:histidinol-phosphate phosphatase family protein
MQAIILAGGKGTRLASRLNGRPKPLIDVCGEPLLARQLDMLGAHGVDDVVVLVNHAADQIEAFFRERETGPRARLIDDGEPRGTAGAVLACLPELADRFLIVYGDTLFDIDIAAMLAAHERSGADVTLLLHPNDHPADSDLVEIDDQGAVKAFHSYPHPEGADLRNLVNAAFYICEKQALQPWVNEASPLDFAKDLFPRMLVAGARIQGYVSFEYIKDLGTPKRLEKCERHLASGVVERARRHHPQKAVFIDRDGTLNHLRGFLNSADQLALLPGAARAVARLNEAEYRVVLTTNQPVLARGETDRDGMARIHARLETLLGHEGGYLDAIYLCPHHPDGGFPGEVPELKIACDCRKPGVGMFMKAISDLNIDAAASWMVGDSTADMLAAETVGVTSILVATGEGGQDGKWVATPELVAEDALAAARLIIDVVPAFERALAGQAATVAPGSLLLVGGLARSGKTTVAAALRRLLAARGVSSRIIHVDSWIRSHAERADGLLGRYDMDALGTGLAGWLNGSDAVFDEPVYDRLSRESRTGRQVRIGSEDVVILEGVPSFLPAWSTDRAVVRIWTQCDAGARDARVEDDLVSRGLATADQAREVRVAREADEVAIVIDAKGTADVVLHTDQLMASGS